MTDHDNDDQTPNNGSETHAPTSATIVYCFVNARWGDDVVGVAVCAVCGAAVGEHVSSSPDYARYDLSRPYHTQDYERHVKEQHATEAVQVVWLEKPQENAELRAVLDNVQESRP